MSENIEELKSQIKELQLQIKELQEEQDEEYGWGNLMYYFHLMRFGETEEIRKKAGKDVNDLIHSVSGIYSEGNDNVEPKKWQSIRGL